MDLTNETNVGHLPWLGIRYYRQCEAINGHAWWLSENRKYAIWKSPNHIPSSGKWLIGEVEARNHWDPESSPAVLAMSNRKSGTDWAECVEGSNPTPAWVWRTPKGWYEDAYHKCTNPWNGLSWMESLEEASKQCQAGISISSTGRKPCSKQGTAKMLSGYAEMLSMPLC